MNISSNVLGSESFCNGSNDDFYAAALAALRNTEEILFVRVTDSRTGEIIKQWSCQQLPNLSVGDGYCVQVWGKNADEILNPINLSDSLTVVPNESFVVGAPLREPDLEALNRSVVGLSIRGQASTIEETKSLDDSDA